MIQKEMIDKQLIADTVSEFLAATDAFPVEVRIDGDNNITVEIDSLTGVDIDTCAALSRRIDEVLDRDVEDYSLEVGSSGLTSPFKVRGQYEKNLGNDVVVLTRDGRKLHGVLASVDDADGADGFTFTVETAVRRKEPGAKRPVTVTEAETFSPADIRSIVYDLKV